VVVATTNLEESYLRYRHSAAHTTSPPSFIYFDKLARQLLKLSPPPSPSKPSVHVPDVFLHRLVFASPCHGIDVHMASERGVPMVERTSKLQPCCNLFSDAFPFCSAASIGLGVSYFCVMCDDNAVVEAAHDYVRAVSHKETSPCGMVELDKCPADLVVSIDRVLFKTKPSSSYIVVLHASVGPRIRHVHRCRGSVLSHATCHFSKPPAG
jgi:hypothetical protein